MGSRDHDVLCPASAAAAAVVTEAALRSASPCTILTVAALGDAVSLKRLLSAGVSPNLRDTNGVTPLLSLLLGRNANRRAAALLLDAGADANAADAFGMTPLHRSTRAAVMATLLSRGADVHARDSNGETALHWAAVGKRPQLLRLLIAAGADAEAVSSNGMSAWKTARANEYGDVMGVLVLHGLDVLAANESCDTELCGAARVAADKLTRRDVELAAGAPYVEPASPAPSEAELYMDEWPLYRLCAAAADDTSARLPVLVGALERRLMSAAMRGDAAAVQRLLDFGVSPDVRDADGNSALMAAVEINHVRTLTALLDAGADVGVRGDVEYNRRDTVLHRARSNVVTSLLLSYGADVHARDDDGFTPLFFAASNGLEREVRLLLAAGADAEAEDNAGRSPLEESQDHPAVVATLLLHGADKLEADPRCRTKLCAAARRALAREPRSRLEATAGVKPAAKTAVTSSARGDKLKQDMTDAQLDALTVEQLCAAAEQQSVADPLLLGALQRRLFTAAAGGDAAAVKQLLRAGASTDAYDTAGDTPLIAAIEGNDLATITAMLDGGAAVNAVSRDVNVAETALHRSRSSAATQLLLSRGADVHARDADNFTPLHWAATGGSAAEVRLLLAAGSDADAVSDSGRTALDLAQDKQHATVTATLLLHGADKLAADAGCNSKLCDAARFALQHVSRGRLEASAASLNAGAAVDEATGAQLALLLLMLVPLLYAFVLLPMGRRLRRNCDRQRRRQQPTRSWATAVHVALCTFASDAAARSHGCLFSLLDALRQRQVAVYAAIIAMLQLQPPPPAPAADDAVQQQPPARPAVAAGMRQRRKGGGRSGAQAAHAGRQSRQAQAPAPPRARTPTAAEAEDADADAATATTTKHVSSADEPSWAGAAPAQEDQRAAAESAEAAPPPLPPLLPPPSLLPPPASSAAVPLPAAAEAQPSRWTGPVPVPIALPLPLPLPLPVLPSAPPAAPPPPPEAAIPAAPAAEAATGCTICMDAPLEGTFVPCGHVAACMACGDRIMRSAAAAGARCPICSAAAERFIRIRIVS